MELIIILAAMFLPVDSLILLLLMAALQEALLSFTGRLKSYR